MTARALYFLLLFFFGSQFAFAQSSQSYPVSSKSISFLSTYIPFDPKTTLTWEQIREDIQYLKSSIKAVSGLYKFSPDQSGRQFLYSLNTIEKTGMRAIDLCSLLEEKSTLFKDGHFAVVTEDMTCNGRLDSKDSISGTGSNFGKNLALTWELNYFRNEGKKIPVLSIHHFAQPQDPAWDGFLETAKNLRDHQNVFVIDLRGNSGGSDAMGGQLASLLYDGNPPIPYASVIYGNNRAVFESWENLISIFRIKKEHLKEDTSIEGQMIEGYKQKANLASQGQLPATQTQRFEDHLGNPGQNHFLGKIYVLIDHACASSCESTTDFLRSLPFVITAGENTDGAIHYGNIGFIQLPNSKIGFTMGTSYAKYKDGIIRELTGISPRIQVPHGTDALTAIAPSL